MKLRVVGVFRVHMGRVDVAGHGGEQLDVLHFQRTLHVRCIADLDFGKRVVLYDFGQADGVVHRATFKNWRRHGLGAGRALGKLECLSKTTNANGLRASIDAAVQQKRDRTADCDPGQAIRALEGQLYACALTPNRPLSTPWPARAQATTPSSPGAPARCGIDPPRQARACSKMSSAEGSAAAAVGWGSAASSTAIA